MSFFITLIERSDAQRRAIERLPRVQAMMRQGMPAPEYLAFLRDLYHVVWHFCPVMAAAASRMDERLREVRDSLWERIEEEKGHERWVLEDLAAMGGAKDAAAVGAPSAPVQAMIGYNYYAAERLHPCAVLGMLYVLEVIASVYGGKAADAIARALGRDAAAGGFRFLSSHATMDVDHMAKLNLLLKTVADPPAQEAILDATRVNFHQFGQLFGEGGYVSHLAPG